MDWDALRLLVCVAEAGSLRAAAATLGQSQPTVGRRLRALERDLGAALVIRHARGIALTAEGQAVVEVARGLGREIEGMQRGLAGRTAEVRGRVRIACTEPVAVEILPPSLARLRRDHPALGIDLVVNTLASDLDRREADLAIRMFQPEHASLIARKVGTSFTALYATRAYLAERGVPTSLQDLLEGHEVIAPDRLPLFVEQARRMGLDLDLASFRTDSIAATVALTRAGVAIGALVGATVRNDPDLVQVLEPLNHYPVWLVTHPDLFTSAAVRAVWDRLAEDLPASFGPKRLDT